MHKIILSFLLTITSVHAATTQLENSSDKTILSANVYTCFQNLPNINPKEHNYDEINNVFPKIDDLFSKRLQDNLFDQSIKKILTWYSLQSHRDVTDINEKEASEIIKILKPELYLKLLPSEKISMFVKINTSDGVSKALRLYYRDFQNCFPTRDEKKKFLTMARTHLSKMQKNNKRSLYSHIL